MQILSDLMLSLSGLISNLFTILIILGGVSLTYILLKIFDFITIRLIHKAVFSTIWRSISRRIRIFNTRFKPIEILLDYNIRFDDFQSLSIEKILSKYKLPKNKKALIFLKPNFNNDLNSLAGNSTDLRIIVAVIKALKKRKYSNIVIGEGPNCGINHMKIDAVQLPMRLILGF